MFQLESPPGRVAFVHGKEYLFFSGYSYLGMGHCKEFIRLVQDGVEKFGILHPSSRISNTKLGLYEEVESLLSLKTGLQQTVLYSSGYLAGRAIAELYSGDKYARFTVPGSHPAIQTPATMLPSDWQNSFKEAFQNHPSNEIVLFVDSVNPLTATIADLSFLEKIKAAKKITCVIDDSHGIGLLGNGEGISGILPANKNVEYVLTYSLSKAYHINAGAVSCSSVVAENLRKSSYFTASTAPSPAVLYAFLHAQELYKEQLQKLRKNISSFTKKLTVKMHFNPALPLFMLNKNYDEHHWESNRIIISSFSYPDPAGEKVNRIVLNALHTEDDLQKLASLL